MDLREFRVVVRIVDRVAKRALFAEEQMVALEGQCAEWRRIADELKAARNLTTATAESVIKERDALREDLRREEESHEETAQLLKTVDQKVRLLTQERDALRTECDDLRRVFSLVHGSLGIQQGEHIGNAIDALKKERDELATRLRQSIARGDFAEMRLATLAAELDAERERHKQKPIDVPRAHPVKAGEYVVRIDGDLAGQIAQVLDVQCGQYEVRFNQHKACWSFFNCAPCDPPQEASHDTLEGKRTAEGALPQPRDVVRLVRAPTEDEWSKHKRHCAWRASFGNPGDLATVLSEDNDDTCRFCVGVELSNSTWVDWPLSCVEVVKGGKS